jgi:hypothetical protein
MPPLPVLGDPFGRPGGEAGGGSPACLPTHIYRPNLDQVMDLFYSFFKVPSLL